MRIPEAIKDFKDHDFITDEEYQNLPIIVGGDFNCVSFEKIAFDTDFTWGIIYKSAYLVDGKYPEFTTYKCWPDLRLKKEALDYIFYNQNSSNDTFKLKSIREMCSESDMVKGIGNPCHKNASDHFPLAATFEY